MAENAKDDGGVDQHRRTIHMLDLDGRVDVITTDATKKQHAYEFIDHGNRRLTFDTRVYKADSVPSWSPKPPHKPTRTVVEYLDEHGYEIVGNVNAE